MVQDRSSYSYNGGPIGSHTWSIERAISKDLERPQIEISMSSHSLALNKSEMAKDTAIVTMEGE